MSADTTPEEIKHYLAGFERGFKFSYKMIDKDLGEIINEATHEVLDYELIDKITERFKDKLNGAFLHTAYDNLPIKILNNETKKTIYDFILREESL